MALNELIIQENILYKIKGRACLAFTNLKKNGVLNRFFIMVEINERLIFIYSLSKIISECIIFKDLMGNI